MRSTSLLSAVLFFSCLAVSFADWPKEGTGSVAIGNAADQNFLRFSIKDISVNLYNDNSDSDWSVEEKGLGEFLLRAEDVSNDQFQIQIQNDDGYTQQELVDLLNSEVSYIGVEDDLGDDVADVIGYAVHANRRQDSSLSLNGGNNGEDDITTRIYNNAEELVALVEAKFVFISPSTPGGPRLPPTL